MEKECLQMNIMNRMKLFSLLLVPTAAFAEGAPTGPAGGFTPMIPLVLMFGVFYFLVIRPQQKKQKEHQRFLTELKKGDMVVTQAGIIGTIRTLSERFVTLEVDGDVCLKMLRGQIAESAANLPKDTQEGKK